MRCTLIGVMMIYGNKSVDEAVNAFANDTQNASTAAKANPVKVQHGGGQHRTEAGSRVKASSAVVDGLATPPNTPYDNTMLTRKDIDEIRRLGQIGKKSL